MTALARLLQEVLVILAFKHLRKMRKYTVLTRNRSHFCSRHHWRSMRRTGSVCTPMHRVSPKFFWNTFINQIIREFLQLIRQFMRYVFLYFFWFTIFMLVFGFCGFMQRVFPKLFIRTSTSCWHWSFHISVIWYWISVGHVDSCDEDDDEEGEGVVEEELADIPGTTNGTYFDTLQPILLPLLMKCGFDRFSSDTCAHALRRASRVKELLEFLEEAQQLYRRFFICSHLAVGRHHRRRTPWCPRVQLSRVKVFLTDHMHTHTGINHKLSLTRLSCWGTWRNPLFFRREECCLVVRFELVYIFGKIPSLALGTSLLSFSLFVGPILEIL